MLSDAPVTVTIPFVDLDKARQFYGGTLDLPEAAMPAPEGPDGQPMGIAYAAGNGTTILIYARATPTTADHTAMTFVVDNIDAVADALISRGITFETYPDMPGVEWDDRGLASTPGNGAMRSAWFTDPEGNILAISSMPS